MNLSSVALIRTAHREGTAGPTADRVFVGSASVAVLSGGTGPASGDDGGLTDQLGIELMRLLETDLGGALPDLVARAVRAAAAPGGSSPAAVGILRWSPTNVDALVLNSAPIVVRTRDGAVDQLRADRATHRPNDRTWPCDDVETALMMAGSVAAGAERYGLVEDWATGLALAADDPEGFLDAIEAAELSDVEDFGRSGRDSKALAVISFGPA